MNPPSGSGIKMLFAESNLHPTGCDLAHNGETEPGHILRAHRTDKLVIIASGSQPQSRKPFVWLTLYP